MRLALLLVVAIALGSALLGAQPSSETLMIHSKSRHLALAADSIYGMSATRQARILFNYDDDWTDAAIADCDNWTITINHRMLTSNLDFMLQNIMPHEYGHLVHCFINGDVGADPHNLLWQSYVWQLGGDPSHK
jgi:predicted SprT family Zn-dependent metalloprotease